MIYVPSSSQFHYKTETHEQVHYDQWTAGGEFDIFENLVSPSAARALIMELTATTQQELDRLVTSTLVSYWDSQVTLYGNLSTDAEREAHAETDGMTPSYIYSNCGRY